MYMRRPLAEPTPRESTTSRVSQRRSGAFGYHRCHFRPPRTWAVGDIIPRDRAILEANAQMHPRLDKAPTLHQPGASRPPPNWRAWARSREISPLLPRKKRRVQPCPCEKRSLAGGCEGAAGRFFTRSISNSNKRVARAMLPGTSVGTCADPRRSQALAYLCLQITRRALGTLKTLRLY